MLMVDTDQPPNQGIKVKTYWQRKEKAKNSKKMDLESGTDSEEIRGTEKWQDTTKKNK
jgi:hypothetical protein